MSAIGNYVHFHKQNYEEYGIKQVGKQKGESWENTITAFKNNLGDSQEMVKLMQEAKILEEQYNELFYPSNGDSSKKAETFKKALEDSIQNKLDEQFGLNAGTFDSSTLTVNSSELYEKMKAAVEDTKKRLGEVTIRNTADKMLEEVEKMKNILNDKEMQKVEGAKQKIDQAKKQLERIAKNLQSEINKAGGKLVKIDKNSQDIQTMSAIIQEFNRLYPLYNQSGVAFEWLLPFIKFQTSELVEQTLINDMKALASNPNVILANDYVQITGPDFTKKGITDIDIITNNISIKTYTTRSKTDVIISYEEDNKESSVTTEKAVSAKNISDSQIKIVKDTPLYKILILSNMNDFATHYLNVVTAARGQRSTLSRIKTANRFMQALILRLGAEGYDVNNKAELLIINKDKHIYVYNLKALIYIIQSNMLENKNRPYSSVTTDLPENYTIKQEFDKNNKANRITKIIQATQNQKITAYIKSSMLNSYLDALKLYKT